MLQVLKLKAVQLALKGGRGFMKPCKRRLNNRMRLLKILVVILRAYDSIRNRQ